VALIAWRRQLGRLASPLTLEKQICVLVYALETWSAQFCGTRLAAAQVREMPEVSVVGTKMWTS